MLLLFIVGLGLVWLVYGPAAALTGLLCLLGALIPTGLIALVIWGLDWALRRSQDEDS